MCFFMSLIPATIFAAIGYVVLFCSSRAEGGIRRFGQILAIWIFVVALFPPIAGAFMTITGQCPVMDMLQGLE